MFNYVVFPAGPGYPKATRTSSLIGSILGARPGVVQMIRQRIVFLIENPCCDRALKADVIRVIKEFAQASEDAMLNLIDLPQPHWTLEILTLRHVTGPPGDRELTRECNQKLDFRAVVEPRKPVAFGFRISHIFPVNYLINAPKLPTRSACTAAGSRGRILRQHVTRAQDRDNRVTRARPATGQGALISRDGHE